MTRLTGIRYRLTAVYSTLFGLFICIFAYITSVQYIQTLREDFDSALLNYAIDLADVIVEGKSKASFNIPNREFNKRFPFMVGQTHYIVRDIDGSILSVNENNFPIRDIPYLKSLAQKPNYTHRFQSLEIADQIYRAINLRVSNGQGRAMILQVATNATILEEQENRTLYVNLITIPLLILISSVISYVIAGNALNPIKVVTETANNIAASNLSLRVPELKSKDEVADLSRTFNTLLERLEKSFMAQEHFVANASHQLNTPLAIIKGELDVLESKERTPEENQRFRKSLREEIERLIELVKNMLLISRVEAGQETFIFHPVRVDEILLSTTSRLNLKAREKKITLKFNMAEELDSDAVEVNGEKQLLTSLFENILDNAIKYSPENSTVGINIEQIEGQLEVQIADEGPGILTSDYQNISSKRFQRGSKMLLPGTGIGLSIAYQIAEYHNATISYTALQPKGSLFSVRFLNKTQ